MKIINEMLIVFLALFTLSCSNMKEKEGLRDSLSCNLGLKDKLTYLIIYSEESHTSDATRQVARCIGCTKSTIDRILNGEMQPTPLMQNEVDIVFRSALKKKNLKDLDKSLNFWQRNIAFWYSPDTIDNYSHTINPLFEEIP